MLLKITERCSMHCSHCMNRSDENGPHMSFETLQQAVRKLNELPCQVLILTGGEPTEHPELLSFAEYLSKNLSYLNRRSIILATNGLFLADHIETARRLYRLFPRFHIQVTNDRRFYPKDIDERKPFFHLKYVMVCRSIQTIMPQGRALDNHIPTNRNSSTCINCRSFIHQLPESTIEATITALEQYQKYCSPAIGVDGLIRAGESSLCPAFGSVYDSNAVLSRNLRHFQCNRCWDAGLNHNLPAVLKNMLGVPPR